MLKGIPAVALKPGTLSSDPAIDGKAALSDFLKNHYHQSSDDLSLPFDSQAAQRFTQAGLLMGLIVADDDTPPQWLESDFFGDKFAK